MSYDIRVWSTASVPDLQSVLPDLTRWTQAGEAAVLSGRQWQVVVGPQQRVELEDVPDEVAALLPGIAFLTELNLEPINAPQTARTLLMRAAKSLAKVLHGVIEDPQDGSLTAPGGVRRYVPEPRPEHFDVLQLSWWFNAHVLDRIEGLEQLLTLFERLLPEAMPRRYGLYQPPQFRFAETGREPFLDFLFANRHEMVIWYPNRPLLDVHVGLPKVQGASRRGFRSNFLSLSMEAAALRQPGWETGMRRVFAAISELLEPFYGDVRTLRGFVRMGATYGSDTTTESHPVRSWWWSGVPGTLGHAAVLGSPYIELWPEFVRRAQKLGDLAVLAPSSWTDSQDAAGVVGGVPACLRQLRYPELVEPQDHDRDSARNREYPPVWPFEDPYDEVW